MNAGGGPLSSLNAENIPSATNSHQNHVIAIARNFRRSRQQELAPLQITNTFLRNRNNRLSKLVEKQQYDLVEGTIHSIISSIEYDEEREKKCIEYNEEKENLIINYEVKQTMSDMIHHIENIQTQPTVINEHPSYKVLKVISITMFVIVMIYKITQ